MNNLFKSTLVALAVTQGISAHTVFAAEKAESTGNDIEVIEIKGFSGSLGKALREKRYSETVVEIISADDLGVLPDVSITDSLVRLPGIAASRDRGNASRISIRGMGPRLNIATMNNREIVSSEPSRDVRFEQFPAELIDSVEVYKSPMANLAEGGISGLVNMNFVSPLSKGKRTVAISGNVMKNSLGDDLPGEDGTGVKGNISYVDQWTETFGVAIGLTYQYQPSMERGVESWNYNNGGNRGDINGNGIPEHAPWGVMAKSKRGSNERTGGLLIAEWRPSDSLTIKGDMFYSKFDIEERDDQMGPGDLGNWWDSSAPEGGWAADAYRNGSYKIIPHADGTEQLVAGSQWGGIDVSVPTWFQQNEMLSTGLKVTHIGDIWTIKADIGYSEASINSVWVDIDPVYVGDAYELGFNVEDTNAAEILVLNGDISNPDSYALGAVANVWSETSPGVWEITSQEFTPAAMNGEGDKELTDEMHNINLDFVRDVEWGIVETFSFGGRFTDRTKINDQIHDWERLAKQDHGLTDFGTSYDIGGGFNVPAIYTFADWTNVANVAFGGYTNPGDRSNKDQLASWELNETNTAAYVMVTMSGELGDIPFSGNVGLRYAKTEVTSTGHEQTNWGDINPISVDHDYSEFLPSLNMLFNITDDSQIRFGMARTMARPPLLEMRTGFSLDNTSLPPTANGGNPTLDPYIANQVDLGYEYFWGDNSAATINFFIKDLESHIGLSEGTVNLDGETYQYTGTVNGDGGTIKGIEVLYQQKLDMLPAPFNGLGIFANYSYTDSEVMEFKPTNNPYNLGGLSKNIASVTLWYEKDNFDARMSYNYRSEFTGINSWLPSQVNLNAAETTIDASLGYQVLDNLKLTLQAQNLTNEASENYWDNDYSKPANNVEWGRRILFGFQLTL